MNKLQYKYKQNRKKKMELGTAIGIFIAVSIVLMAIFCLISRYFNYRIKKAYREQAEIYSLTEGIEDERFQVNEGEYEDFVLKRVSDQKKRILEKNKHYQQLAEMTTTNIDQNIKVDQVKLYGVSKLKKRLQTQQHLSDQSVRQIISIKSFRPDKLTNRLDSKRTDMKGETNRKALIDRHRSVTKLVCYTQQGLDIVQCKVIELRKERGQISQKKKVQKSKVLKGQLQFQSLLEVYGFEKREYGAFKYTTTYQIVNMKNNEVYETKYLKSEQEKQEMNFASFYIDKDKIDQSGKKQNKGFTQPV